MGEMGWMCGESEFEIRMRLGLVVSFPGLVDRDRS